MYGILHHIKILAIDWNFINIQNLDFEWYTHKANNILDAVDKRLVSLKKNSSNTCFIEIPIIRHHQTTSGIIFLSIHLFVAVYLMELSHALENESLWRKYCNGLRLKRKLNFLYPYCYFDHYSKKYRFFLTETF